MARLSSTRYCGRSAAGAAVGVEEAGQVCGTCQGRGSVLMGLLHIGSPLLAPQHRGVDEWLGVGLKPAIQAPRAMLIKRPTPALFYFPDFLKALFYVPCTSLYLTGNRPTIDTRCKGGLPPGGTWHSELSKKKGPRLSKT
jgi:hypothetical protein